MALPVIGGQFVVFQYGTRLLTSANAETQPNTPFSRGGSMPGATEMCVNKWIAAVDGGHQIKSINTLNRNLGCTRGCNPGVSKCEPIHLIGNNVSASWI